MTKKTDRKTRYQVAYFRFATTAFGAYKKVPDAYGNGNTLDNLLRHAAGRCAVLNYAKAVITDHKRGEAVYELRRHQGSITITSPEKR